MRAKPMVLSTAIRSVVETLIRFYQRVLSPDHAFWAKTVFPHGYCKFHPSCSEYTRMMVVKRGAIRGALRGFWRVIRCNPFSRGGVDAPR